MKKAETRRAEIFREKETLRERYANELNNIGASLEKGLETLDELTASYNTLIAEESKLGVERRSIDRIDGNLSAERKHYLMHGITTAQVIYRTEKHRKARKAGV